MTNQLSPTIKSSLEGIFHHEIRLSDNENTINQYDRRIDSILKNARKIYFKTRGRMQTIFNWSEPKDWEHLAKANEIRIKTTKCYSVMYGKTFNKKLGTIHAIPYEDVQLIDMNVLTKTIPSLIKSDQWPNVKRHHVTVINDTTQHQLIIMTQLKSKESR